MTIVHIANTNFEFELTQTSSQPIEESWKRHAACLQLQFLPLLYASSSDIIAVTSLPESSFLQNLKTLLNIPDLPQLISLQEIEPFQGHSCVSWGPSLQVQTWASQRNMQYSLPTNWHTIQTINSKAFSFNYTSFKEAVLIHNLTTLKQWLKEVPYPKVLKTCFGLSGLGHLIIDENTNPKKIEDFCNREWKAQRPLIGEPWVKRLFDFSTQWLLTASGNQELLGATVFQTQSNGRYLGTLTGPQELIFQSYLPFLYEHINLVKKMLTDLTNLGYYGHVGVDALIYWSEETKEVKLYPIVEINARQTLSLVALRLQKIKFPEHVIRLSFDKKIDSLRRLLPSSLENIFFKQNIWIEFCNFPHSI